MADPVVPIGTLRWPVLIARRRQNFDPLPAVNIWEDYIQVAQVRAEVMPIAALTFYDNIGTDAQVTHRITVRWLDYLDNYHIVVRVSKRTDGTPRQEIFRIRRIKELNGRKRFSSLDCDLERVD